MTFNYVAPFYDRLAHLVFGRTLERAQLALLGRFSTGGNWLLVGGGTGWLLEQVLNYCGPTTVLYLEASERMLELARKRIDNQAFLTKIEFRLGTETALTEADSFDVILTPFVLDLFTEDWLHNQMIPCLLKTLKPSGFWLATDFVPTTVWWHRLLVKTMQLFFQVTAGIQSHRLSDWMPLLKTRLHLVAQQAALNGMIQSALFKQSS